MIIYHYYCELSIINQTFQKLEIIIVNDNSNDNSKNIAKFFQSKVKKIKIIDHNNNLGVYLSRIEAIFNSRGEYIMLLDPDDMILNPHLFRKLYEYNSNNLDIIEFSVLHQPEGKNNIIVPNRHSLTHFHNFKSNIINQPELSNILFYIPNTKNYTSIICRTIWNKLIRKKVIIKTINYVKKQFNNQYLITADDISLNMINFQFASNYSNIDLPGYLYNLRLNSMSRGNNGNKHEIITCLNYLQFYKLFYRYILDFKKDLNYLYFDLRIFYYYLLIFKKYNTVQYYHNISEFFNEIKKENIIAFSSKNGNTSIKFIASPGII